MSSNPSSKWFWNDWDNDTALRLCSLAAQGLWMRMLSIAARSTPHGYVIINGRSADATDLAHVTGASEAEVRCLIDELDERRVFSRDRHHRIYSRRMVRDHRMRLASVKNGKMGGNKLLLQASENKPQISNGLTRDIRHPSPPYTLSPSSLIPETPIGVSCVEKPRRGTRLPTDFTIPKDWKEAGAECRAEAGLPPVNLDLEAAKFIDYWHAKAGKDGTKLDWLRTWRNWCRTAKSDNKAGLPTIQSNGHSMFDTGPTEPPPTIEGFELRPVRPH